MEFLKTFFGQIFRKSDVDFQNEGARAAVVETHIDYTSENGGIIKGLETSLSNDNKSIFIKPGVFYSRGVYSSNNSFGGGERCEIFSDQFITQLPETVSINGQQSYVLVYAKTLSQNNNPDTTKSQNIATSKNIQTGENIPIRSYTAGTIVVTNPLLKSEIENINGIPLALAQVDSSGNIINYDESIRLDYSIGGLINIPKKKMNAVAIADNFIQSRMIGDNQIIYSKLADGIITSPELAEWDGSSSGATIGSGVATDHFKDYAVDGSKLNSTKSLNEFSTKNRIFNGSFEIEPNTTPVPGTSAISSQVLESFVRLSYMPTTASDPLLVGQKFSPSATSSTQGIQYVTSAIGSLQVKIRLVDALTINVGKNYDIVVDIYSDNLGVPGSLIGSSSNINKVSVGSVGGINDLEICNFTFPTTVTVVNGQLYWAILRVISPSLSSTQLAVAAASSNGAGALIYNGSGWTPMSGPCSLYYGIYKNTTVSFATTQINPDLVGWNAYNAVAAIPSYSGANAGIYRTTDQFLNGFYSVVIKGADKDLIPGGQPVSVAMYQDIPFNNIKLNGEPVSAFFYMKTDADIPMNIAGVTGITSSIQFISNGSLVGDQYQVANYTGSQIDWTKFETSEPIRFTGTQKVDGVRFMISGVTTSAVNVYIDDVFVGITSITPSWSISAIDSQYSDTLYKKNINSTNVTFLDSSIDNIQATNIIPITSSSSFVGTPSKPFDIIYTDSLIVNGLSMSNNAQKILAFTGISVSGSIIPSGLFTIPNGVSRINVELVGGGGGGAAGANISSTAFYGSQTIADDRIYLGYLSATPYRFYGYSGLGTTSLVLNSTITMPSSQGYTELFVADNYGKKYSISSSERVLHIYDSNGAVVSNITLPTSFGVSSISDIDVDNLGNVFMSAALNSGNRVIIKYNINLNQFTIVFSYTYPINHISLDGFGNIYIDNYGGTTGHVHKLNSLASPIVSMGVTVSGTSPVRGMDCDNSGNIIISYGLTLRKYSPAGALLWSIAPPVSQFQEVACDNFGNIYVTCNGNGENDIYKYNSSGVIQATYVNIVTQTISKISIGGIGASGRTYSGGGGGGGGGYVKKSIGVSGGDVLTLSIGEGGAGGFAGISGDVASLYYGANGGDTKIINSFGTTLAVAAGGFGGGYGTPASVSNAGNPGGSIIYSDNLISISGNIGSSGNISRYNTSQGSSAQNGGGEGGAACGGSIFYSVLGGSGGVGWNAGGSHPVNSAMNGSRGAFGSGGGGGGGSLSPIILVPSGSRGGHGGAGGNGFIVIYY